MANKKVKSITLAANEHGEPWTYPKHGGGVEHASVITFEDGSKGKFFHVGTTQDHFTVGQNAEFTAKEITTGPSPWWKLTKPKAQYSGGGGGSRWIPPSTSEVKRGNIGYAAGYVKDLVIAGTINLDQFPTTLTMVMNAISTEVDRIND